MSESFLPLKGKVHFIKPSQKLVPFLMHSLLNINRAFLQYYISLVRVKWTSKMLINHGIEFENRDYSFSLYLFFCHLPKGGVLKTLPIIPRVCGVWTFKRRSSLIHIFAKLSLIGWPTNQNLKQSSRFLPVEAYYLHNGMGAWKNNFVHKKHFFYKTVNGKIFLDIEILLLKNLYVCYCLFGNF